MNLPCPLPNAHCPQGLVSCLYRLETKTPVDFEPVGQCRRAARGARPSRCPVAGRRPGLLLVRGCARHGLARPAPGVPAPAQQRRRLRRLHRRRPGRRPRAGRPEGGRVAQAPRRVSRETARPGGTAADQVHGRGKPNARWPTGSATPGTISSTCITGDGASRSSIRHPGP